MAAVSEACRTDAAVGRGLARLTAIENVQVVASACETTGGVGDSLCTRRLDVGEGVVVEQKRNDLVNTQWFCWKCHTDCGQTICPRGHSDEICPRTNCWDKKNPGKRS